MNERRHSYAPELIKEGDVRGVFGVELTLEDAYHLGRAFGTVIAEDRRSSCVVGYDGRLSSPGLAAQVIAGLADSGISIKLIGLVSTPALYFAVTHLAADAGIMVTASHNPAEDNGLKFVLQDALFHGKDLQRLKTISEAGEYADASVRGDVHEYQVLDAYAAYLVSFLELRGGEELDVVWDPGNGAAGTVLPRFISTLPGKHLVICGEVDGAFPNHHPDPSKPGNMRMLRERVLSERADLGIAFDGDGDRIGVVDSRGRILTGEQLLVIFAREYLKQRPGASVLSEVKASAFLYADIAEHGGVPIMWKVGHANQKEKMQQEGIGLAGETSGHFFFEENRGHDDGLFAAVKLLNILEVNEVTLAEIVDGFPVIYHTGEIRIALPATERYRLIEDIAHRLSEAGRPFIDIDGVRVPCGDGFWIMRCSNTQPHITIYCESDSEDGMEACRAEMVGQVEASGYTFDELVVAT